MDNYIEIAVARKQNISDRIKSFFASVLPMLVGCYIIMLCFSLDSLRGFVPVAIIICAVMVFLSYKIFCSFNIEWEYTLVGNELRFAKIINKSKRRDIITIDLGTAEIMARTDDREHTGVSGNSVRKITMTSQCNDGSVFLIARSSKGERVCIVFEPDERMLNNFRISLKGKLYI